MTIIIRKPELLETFTSSLHPHPAKKKKKKNTSMYISKLRENFYR